MALFTLTSFNYPSSQYLGAKPCGANCNRTGCTLRQRFKDGDNDLALARKQVRLGNNRSYMNSATSFSSPNLENENVIIGGKSVGSLGGLTPFRAFMNAGDPALTHNSPNVDPSQLNGWNPLYTTIINQVSTNKRSSNKRMGGSTPIINYSQAPVIQGSLWTGNNKFVYDGSDYVKYKKLSTGNKNYNDVTSGGDNFNAAQTALLRVRRR